MVDLTNPRLREHFQCPLSEEVHLTVSICTNIYCHHWTGIVVKTVLFSLLCYGNWCILKVPVGCLIFYVDLGQPPTTPSFLLRKTSSCKWAQGPRPGDPEPAEPSAPRNQTQHPLSRWVQPGFHGLIFTSYKDFPSASKICS